MLCFTVRMQFLEAALPAVRAHLEALTTGSRQEPGCLVYNAHFSADDPCTVLIYELYADEAALEHHRGTPHFRDHASGGLYQHMQQRHVENLHLVA